MSDIQEFRIKYTSQFEVCLIELQKIFASYIEKNNLISCSTPMVYKDEHPIGLTYFISFTARKKTHSEILREQIEFQIKQLTDENNT
ncbi:hypothetical protein [Flavobacterium columnare]|uniref:hypothetical protein n=1 Tax=Flavobacterium columnare TaxID=996 RepID=UPI0013D6E41D|nr:hypothetical protein [Flavobacterium columnare]